MNAYTIALIFAGICGSLGKHNRYQDSVNVGTVLFTPSDYTNPHWNKDSIALLQARQYYQYLIPPTNYIDANHEYVDELLNYFHAAYSSIKKETKDPEVDIIMTKALSDTIGGYLKHWILPIAKIAFYGGTVTSRKSIKLFNFYSEIKYYLRTNGSGWKEPDPKQISSIQVSVNQTPQKYVRNAEPCQLFAYLENTKEGVTVPLPYIDWNEKILFVPLKEYPLISLYSEKYTHALERYYDAALNCLAVNNPNASINFDTRFQRWLRHDVVSHLGDDTLYIALFSVLGMVNKSKESYGSMLEMCHNGLPEQQNSVDYNSIFTTVCINECLKKTIVICIILLLEVIWCIVALKHLCAKKKATSDYKGEFINAYRNEWEKPDKKNKKASISESKTCVAVPGGGIKLYQRPKIKRKDFNAQKPSTVIENSKTIGTNTFSTKINPKVSKEVVNIIDENYQTNETQAKLSAYSILQPQPKDSPYLFPKKMSSRQALSYKESHSQTFCNCGCMTDHIIEIPSDDNITYTKTNTNTPENMNSNFNIKNSLNFVTVQEKKPPKTITLFKKNQKSIGRATRESDDSTLLIRRTTVSERTGLVLDRLNKTFTPSNNRCDCSSICHCTSYSQLNEKINLNQEHIHICDQEHVSSVRSCKSSLDKKAEIAIDHSGVAETKPHTLFRFSDKDDETKIQNDAKSLTYQTQKEVMMSNKKEDTWNFNEAFVKIKIDRPKTEIRVFKSALKSSEKSQMHSRIPKKTWEGTRQEQTENQTGIFEEYFKDDEQMIGKALISVQEENTNETHKKKRETVTGKPVKDTEQIHYEGTRSNREDLKRRGKVLKKYSRRTGLNYRAPEREARLFTDTLVEDTKQVPQKTVQFVKNGGGKESKKPSKCRSTNSLNIDQDSLNKPDRDMNKVSVFKDNIVQTFSERVDMDSKKELKTPDEELCIYKHVTDLCEKKSKTSYKKPLHKSLIPQPIKCTVDDTLIRPDKIKDSKLNITL